jgi:O-antigen/teichoic acid export membrane protein
LNFAVLARALTKEQFAIYNLVFGFIAVLRLTALPGLGTAVSQAFARGLQGGFRHSVMLSFIGSLVGAVILIAGSWWHFQLEEVAVGQAILVAAVFFPSVAGLMFWRNAAAGSERYLWLLWFDGFSSALKFGAVFACAYVFPGILFPIVIAALIAPALINFVATMRQLRSIPSDAAREPNFVEYGIRTTLYQLPTVLAQQLDKLALFYFISPKALAVYAVALRIPELARTVVGETNATLGPVFARNDIYNKALHRFSLKLCLLYWVVSAVGAILIVPYLLPMLAGDGYLEAVPYAQIMTIGVAMGYLGDIQFRYIKSHLHSRNFLTVTLLRALLDCLLILGLAYYFGLVGIVAAYALKNLGHTTITNVVIRSNYLEVQTSR